MPSILTPENVAEAIMQANALYEQTPKSDPWTLVALAELRYWLSELQENTDTRESIKTIEDLAEQVAESIENGNTDIVSDTFRRIGLETE